MSQTDQITLPPPLIASMRDQRVVLFLGAGASREGRNAEGMAPPLAGELRDLLAKKFFNKEMQDYDLMTLAEMAMAAHNQSLVFEFIRTLLDPFQPSDAHKLLPTFRWRAIATTNYDLLVERAYAANSARLQDLVPFVKDNEPVEERLQKHRNPVQLLKLHGCINDIHDKSTPIILSNEHYSRYSNNRTHLYSRLTPLAQQSPIVFCGYRLGDAHIRSLIYDLEGKGMSTRPTYYMVSPNASREDITFWATLRVEIISSDFCTFMKALDAAIPALARKLPFQDTAIAHPIRKYFATNSPESENLRSALDRDLSLVRSDMDVAKQDPKQFYQGYDTGWGAIVQRLDVRRKVEEEVLYEIIEGNNEPTQSLLVIKGPAGNGKTVALKRIAWETSGLGCIALWLNHNGAIDPEIFIELYGLTNKRLHLFVDRIAIHEKKIGGLLRVAKQKNIPITVIAAERDNEWVGYCNQLQIEWRPIDFRINKLSRNEVEQLIDLLSRHKSLGVLEGAARQDQIAAFYDKGRADRQLLVALHEATNGAPFEDIVLDEYSRIIPETAQQLYLDICTLYQFAVPARAGTISRVSKISFMDYQERFLDPLTKIVLTRKDEYTGDYQYHARHAHVAAMVFKQVCSDDEKKLSQLTRLIGALDIGYAVDRHVLERLTKGHALSESVVKAESGRAIYNLACDIAPNDAFLLQQWAIFESRHRDGSLTRAAELADQARAQEKYSNTIIHTQAEIARKRANQESSLVLKQQFRRQARERLGESTSKNRYATSTYCKIFVDEVAELSSGANENGKLAEEQLFFEKVKDAEKMIAQALQIYPEDADILQTDARLKQILNQNERALKALEQAWKAGPRGAGVAIRLANIYSDKGDVDKAIEKLEEALQRNPDDKSANYEIAKHLLTKSISSDYDNKILGHLTKSYSKGDQNYEARYLHAKFLFKIGKIPQSAELFEEISRNAPEGFRLTVPKDHTSITASLPPYSGTIITKRGATMFIKSAAFSNNIYSNQNIASVEEWDDLNIGDEVKFRLKFNRHGPVAINVDSTE